MDTVRTKLSSDLVWTDLPGLNTKASGEVPLSSLYIMASRGQHHWFQKVV